MIKFTRIAGQNEIEERKRMTLAALGFLEASGHSEDETPSQQPDSPRVRVSEELLGYLRLIADTPGVPATERDDAKSILRKKGVAFRKRLKELGLIEACEVGGRSRGRNFRDIRPTLKGLQALENRRKT